MEKICQVSQSRTMSESALGIDGAETPKRSSQAPFRSANVVNIGSDDLSSITEDTGLINRLSEKYRQHAVCLNPTLQKQLHVRVIESINAEMIKNHLSPENSMENIKLNHGLYDRLQAIESPDPIPERNRVEADFLNHATEIICGDLLSENLVAAEKALLKALPTLGHSHLCLNEIELENIYRLYDMISISPLTQQDFQKLYTALGIDASEIETIRDILGVDFISKCILEILSRFAISKKSEYPESECSEITVCQIFIDALKGKKKGKKCRHLMRFFGDCVDHLQSPPSIKKMRFTDSPSKLKPDAAENKDATLRIKELSENYRWLVLCLNKSLHRPIHDLVIKSIESELGKNWMPKNSSGTDQLKVDHNIYQTEYLEYTKKLVCKKLLTDHHEIMKQVLFHAIPLMGYGDLFLDDMDRAMIYGLVHLLDRSSFLRIHKSLGITKDEIKTIENALNTNDLDELWSGVLSCAVLSKKNKDPAMSTEELFLTTLEYNEERYTSHLFERDVLDGLKNDKVNCIARLLRPKVEEIDNKTQKIIDYFSSTLRLDNYESFFIYLGFSYAENIRQRLKHQNDPDRRLFLKTMFTTYFSEKNGTLEQLREVMLRYNLYPAWEDEANPLKWL